MDPGVIEEPSDGISTIRPPDDYVEIRSEPIKLAGHRKTWHGGIREKGEPTKRQPSLLKRLVIHRGVKKKKKTEYHLGLTQKLFALFSPKYQVELAIIMMILLKIMGVVSDIMIFNDLHSRGFTTDALALLGANFIPGLLLACHYHSHRSDAQLSCCRDLVTFLGLAALQPVGTVVWGVAWMCHRSRPGSPGEKKYHFLARTSGYLNGSMTQPLKVILLLRAYCLGVLPLPGLSSKSLCDQMGNCIPLGSSLGIIALVLAVLAILKTSIEVFQTTTSQLSYISFLMPNLALRLLSMTWVIVVFGVWSFCLLLLPLLNLLIGLKMKKDGVKGMNIFSSSISCVFILSPLPDEPQKKDLSGETLIDNKTNTHLASLLALIDNIVIGLLVGIALFLVTKEGVFNIDKNMIFTNNQIKFITTNIFCPLLALSFVTTFLLPCQRTNKAKSYVKCNTFINVLIVILFLTTLVCGIFGPKFPRWGLLFEMDGTIARIHDIKVWSQKDLGEMFNCNITPDKLVCNGENWERSSSPQSVKETFGIKVALTTHTNDSFGFVLLNRNKQFIERFLAEKDFQCTHILGKDRNGWISLGLK